jgi:UDP-N-acetylglucosamine 4,6-dehydratase
MSSFNISRKQKTALMFITDITLVPLSLWITFSLRLGVWFWPTTNQISLFITGPLLALPIFIKFGLYRVVVRYIGQKGMLSIIYASGIFVLLWLLTAVFLLHIPLGSGHGIPRSAPILFWIILILTISSTRQVARWLLLKTTKTTPKKNVLIYGANRLGSELALSLSHDKDLRLLGIIDDDPVLRGFYIKDLEVLGGRTAIEKIRATTSPLEVLLTLPKMHSEQRKELLKYLEDKRVTVKTIPSLSELTSQTATLSSLRDIDTTDLLARREVAPKKELISTCVKDKKIMVTGAGGSIGSELCRQILLLSPTQIILFEHSELNLYQINAELLGLYASRDYDIEIIPILGSITNKQHVEETIKRFKVDIIYHAAAYKHVSLIEHNIEEGIRNNIFGTYTVAQAALNLKVERFILISTDKAVRPSSVMGATKHIAELVIQGLANKNDPEYSDENNGTHFAIVRFGNVLGSSGSVIPLFQKQIADGGPITITHPEATRYFMTIPEASQLVIQAAALAKSCNVFVLDMGKPVSILSLAKQLVYLSGHMLKTDESTLNESGIEIQYTGLQKGEKIHEELFTGENIIKTEHPMIMEAREDFCEWSKVEKMLLQLEPQHKLSNEEIRQRLLQFTVKDSTV